MWPFISHRDFFVWRLTVIYWLFFPQQITKKNGPSYGINIVLKFMSIINTNTTTNLTSTQLLNHPPVIKLGSAVTLQNWTLRLTILSWITDKQSVTVTKMTAIVTLRGPFLTVRRLRILASLAVTVGRLSVTAEDRSVSPMMKWNLTVMNGMYRFA